MTEKKQVKKAPTYDPMLWQMADSQRLYEAMNPSDRDRDRWFNMSAKELWTGQYSPASWIYPRFQFFNTEVTVPSHITSAQLILSTKSCANHHESHELPWNWMRPGTLAYCELARKLFKRDANLKFIEEVQKSFLRGQTVHGIHTCGLCPNSKFIVVPEIEESMIA